MTGDANMGEQIWSWDDLEQRLKLAKERNDLHFVQAAELRQEAERWRRMYEQQWEVNARLQKRVEELEGRK